MYTVQPCTTVYNLLQQYTTLYIHVQSCTSVNNIVQPYNSLVQSSTTVYSLVQPSTTLYNHVQPCTTMYNHAHGCTTVYNHVKLCTKVVQLQTSNEKTQALYYKSINCLIVIHFLCIFGQSLKESQRTIGVPERNLEVFGEHNVIHLHHLIL